MKKYLFTIIGYSFSLAAVFGIVVSLIGIGFLWWLVPGVSNRLVNTATFIQKALNSTDDLLAVSSSTLTQADSNFAQITIATQEMADTLTQTSTIASSVADMVGDDFISVVEDTQTALSSLETSAKLVDDTLAFISAIPFLGSKYSNKTPLYSSVVDINQSLTTLPKNMLGLQTSLSSTSSALTGMTESVNLLTESMGEIETSLKEASEVVESYQLLVDEAQVSISRAIEKLPAWVRWTAVGLTVLLIWAIFIQAGLLLYGWELSNFRRYGINAPVEVESTPKH
jgi:methyl-accepting chemotaxis protein